MRKKVGILFLLVFGVWAVPPADAQGNLSAYQKSLADAKNTGADTPERKEKVRQLLDVEHQPGRFISYAYKMDIREIAFDTLTGIWDENRIDKQLGATSSSVGTTNLVSRPSTPQLLGLAMEFGALTQTTSGSVTTFRANADGAFRAIAGQPIICLGCMGTAGLKNLNFAASFDLSRPGSKQVSTAGPATTATPAVSSIVLPSSSAQFSSLSARYDIYNPKDTRSKQYQDAWRDWFTKNETTLRDAAIALLTATNPFLSQIGNDPKYQTLKETYGPKLVQAAPADMDSILADYLSHLLALAKAANPNFDQQLLSVRAAYAQYGQVYNDAIKDLRGKPQFSFEYTFNRPLNQPDTDNFRFIYGSNPFSGGGLLSANLAVTIYQGQIPAGARYSRFRDVQASAQFDRPLPNYLSYPAVLTLAGYVQYQVDPSVINIQPGLLVPGTSITLPQNAQVLLGPKGTTGIVQGKVTLRMKNSGVRIPIAVTWASRTQLIDATDVRGNVGITYDFDSLLHH